MDGTGIPGSKQGHLWAPNIGNLRDLRKLQYLPDDGSGGVRVTPSSSTFGQGGEPLVVVGERDDGFRERVRSELPLEEQDACGGVGRRAGVEGLVVGRRTGN